MRGLFRWPIELNAGTLGERTSATLAFEELEPLEMLSASPWTQDYASWREQSFSVGDVGGFEVSLGLQNTSDVGIQSNQSLPLIGGDAVKSHFGYTGAGYAVAVIDTGVDYNHSAFAGRYVGGWDFVDNDADPMDQNGHGTHVAGIIASGNATYSGVASGANIIALRVLNASGSGSFGDVESALQWVAANQATYNIVAVNMSLGAGNFSSNPWTFMEDELTTLKSQGVFVAAASGNSFYSYGSQQGLGYPAISNLTVSVGAVWDANQGSVSWGSGARDFTTAADRITSFTQRSSQLDLLAPGAMVTNAYLGGGWATLAGTSMAAPMVAGAAVLAHQALDATGQGHLGTQDHILSVFKSTGVTVYDGDDENDNVVNTGLAYKRLNLLGAIQTIVSAGAPSPTRVANEAFVTELYQKVLGRSVDSGGLASWAASLELGTTRSEVVEAIWSSAEHRRHEVTSNYSTYLGRTPSAGEINYWANKLAGGEMDGDDMVRVFVGSQEYSNAHASNGDFVDAAYQHVLGRSADSTGRANWVDMLDHGTPRQKLINGFLHSTERHFNVVGQYYQQFLGRTASVAELTYWSNSVHAGASLDGIGKAFMASDEFYLQAAGLSLIAAAGPVGGSSAAGVGGAAGLGTDGFAPIIGWGVATSGKEPGVDESFRQFANATHLNSQMAATPSSDDSVAIDSTVDPSDAERFAVVGELSDRIADCHVENAVESLALGEELLPTFADLLGVDDDDGRTPTDWLEWDWATS